MFKRNISFYERKKKILQNKELSTKGKFKLKRKEKFILLIYRIKEKLVLWISGSKRRSFSTQEVGRKMVVP